MPFLLDPLLVRQWFNACRLGESLRSVALATSRPGENKTYEQHTVPTVVVCLQGVVRVRLAKGHVDLQASEALLVPPGVRHEHERLRAGSAFLGVGFMLNFADIEICLGQDTWLLTIAEQPARRLIERACQAGALDRLRLMRDVFKELAQEHARPLASMPEPTRRMWMFLRRERLSPISARDVLRASGLAPTRAKLLFKAWFGTTPLRLLRQHRLEYARHLITDGRPVGEAAAASGFRSRRHLTAACQTVHGVPPSRLGGTQPVSR